MRTLVLASASAGRAALLHRSGVPFLVEASSCGEATDVVDPEERASTLAMRKAWDVAARHRDAVVIGADTVIDLDGRILGKPESPADAERMLARLVGRWHRLVTGLAIVDCSTRARYCAAEITRVHLRELTWDQIHAYAASGEPMGKSGAYEIQGLGAAIIDRIEGDFSNVVGLPLAHLARALEAFDVDILASAARGDYTFGEV